MYLFFVLGWAVNGYWIAVPVVVLYLVMLWAVAGIADEVWPGDRKK